MVARDVEIRYWTDSAGRKHLVVALDADQHAREGTECPCDPRLVVMCQGCDGNGCFMCDDEGVVDATLASEAQAVIHRDGLVFE